MSESKLLKPEYIFEVSWEVCNKVGGIYTVVSTKFPVLKREMGDKVVMIGPDVWKQTEANPDFTEDKLLYKSWRLHAEKQGLKCKVGRWNIPGKPIALLLDITPFFQQKNEIFAELWQKYDLDSLHGGWDYIEPAVFGYAAGKLIESFYLYNLNATVKVIAHFHEWMTGTGALYLHDHAPQIGTLFTTHATVVGRSIAGNGQPLYATMQTTNANQKASEFQVGSKYSLEKISGKFADAFTTVSDLTAQECKYFLGREVDLVTPNGFSDEFVPQGEYFNKMRDEARQLLVKAATAVSQKPINESALLVATSGRYEFGNKGLDVFIDALSQLSELNFDREVVGFILVPANHSGPDECILARMNNTEFCGEPHDSLSTHIVQGKENDPVYRKVMASGLLNKTDSKVRIIFVPTYLNGFDGIFNKSYFELLIGFDLTVFPSYYEPWGYTPMESLAFHIPTVTTSLTGFGRWVRDLLPESNTSVSVIPRDDYNTAQVASEIAGVMHKYALMSDEDMVKQRKDAFEASRIALWDNLLAEYYKAFDIALQKVAGRQSQIKTQPRQVFAQTEELQVLPKSNKPVLKKLFVEANFPGDLDKLKQLAENLWWCWDADATALFAEIDPPLWEESGENPLALLENISIEKLNELRANSAFLNKLEEIYSRFQTYIHTAPKADSPKVAYFCMEYGLHPSLRLYSGGLGVLAGDYLKEASDQNTNIVAVGLLYRHGYFRQELSMNGEQISIFEPQKFTQLPLLPVRDKNENWLKVSIVLPGRTVYAKLWQVDVGRIPLYLLDTDIQENNAEDRKITHSLYGGDREHRLKQEMLLGIGGIRLLDVLGIERDVYHLNEGHAAFIGMERLRKYVQEEHLSFDEAVEVVRSSSLFTTHTPVPAGHDAFREELLRAYISNYAELLNISWEKLIALGRLNPNNPKEEFSMSHLATRLSQEVNGVSEIHGEVSRHMFEGLYEGYDAEDVSIGYVTNGVHLPTWASPEWKKIIHTTLGDNWVEQQADAASWSGFYDLDDSQVWEVRKVLKSRLVEAVKSRLRTEMTERRENPKKIFDIIRHLNDQILFIGFARRFATYKRATLLFQDLDRLARLVNDAERPICFIFAGKAHPADIEGQVFIKRIMEVAQMDRFAGKIFFLVNYDMHLARLLVQGVDVWLNTPTRPLEASGTSGMKATMNGVLNFSVLDGWWAEGYTHDAGWALPKERTYENQDFQNQLDSELIYGIFENEIVPSFYHRNEEGLPVEWLAKIKNSYTKIAPHFTMKRMLDEYIDKYYKPLSGRHELIEQNQYEEARNITQWKNKVIRAWDNIRVMETELYDSSNFSLPLGTAFKAKVVLDVQELSYEDIGVECVFYKVSGDDKRELIDKAEFELKDTKDNVGVYKCEVPTSRAGVYEYGIRIFPKHPLLIHRMDFPLVKWLVF
jgi:phosphorylase/glycogen(starch) synthase